VVGRRSHGKSDGEQHEKTARSRPPTSRAGGTNHRLVRYGWVPEHLPAPAVRRPQTRYRNATGHVSEYVTGPRSCRDAGVGSAQERQEHSARPPMMERVKRGGKTPRSRPPREQAMTIVRRANGRKDPFLRGVRGRGAYTVRRPAGLCSPPLMKRRWNPLERGWNACGAGPVERPLERWRRWLNRGAWWNPWRRSLWLDDADGGTGTHAGYKPRPVNPVILCRAGTVVCAPGGTERT